MDELRVETPHGPLIAAKSTFTDDGYPGIWVSLGGDAFVLVEHNKDQQQIVAKVWKKNCSNDPAVSIPYEECECCV